MRSLILFSLLASSLFCFSQAGTTAPPYRRFPTVPPFSIMLKDSSVYEKKDLPKNKAVWIIIFGPDCDHCQQETREIVAHKNELKGIQVVMITLHPVQRMKTFIADYGLDSLKNLVVGQDHTQFTMSYFGFKNFPFQAFYDRKGKLLDSFEGTKTIEEILQIFK